MTVLETVKLMPNMKEYRIGANGCCYPFNPDDSFHRIAFGAFDVARVNAGYEDGTVELELAVRFVKGGETA